MVRNFKRVCGDDRQQIEEEHPEVEVEIHYGGQPIYYLYFCGVAAFEQKIKDKKRVIVQRLRDE